MKGRFLRQAMSDGSLPTMLAMVANLDWVHVGPISLRAHLAAARTWS
jgi:hypothetical protein